MSIKVALFALLACMSLSSAQLIPINLLPQPASCSTSTGCSISSIVNALSGITGTSLLNFGTYTNANINIDQTLNAGAIVVAGTNNVVNFANGVTASLNSLVVNSSNSIVITGSAQVSVASGNGNSGSVSASGAITVSSSAVLSAAGGIYQNAANFTAQSGAQIQGAVTVAAGAGASIGADLTTTVTVTGTLFVSGATTLGNAAIQSSLTVSSNTQASAQANANVVVTGATSVAQGVSTSAQSNLTVAATAVLTVTGQTSAFGQTAVAGSISSSTQYAQNSSFLQLNGGSVVSPSVYLGASATLAGQGNIGSAGTSAQFVTDGSISIGNSPGTVTVNGDWRPSSTSTFNLELASSTNFDRLIVTGTAYPNGILKCIAISGYVPSDNARHTFVTAGGVQKGFTATIGSTISDLTKWTSQTTSNTVIATYNSAVSVAVSGLVLVACVLASLL